ncbi:hypothetical protein EC988_006238, partial [Linderina pennispora]
MLPRRISQLAQPLRSPLHTSSTPLHPTGSLRAAFCVIGDEILNGKVHDSNSHYFARKCFNLGVALDKIDVVPDQHRSIASTLKHLAHSHDFVFTSGGIGPTHDDITYEAVAMAFAQPLAYHKETLERMHRIMKLRQTHVTLPDPNGSLQEVASARMALFPQQATVEYPCDKYWVPVVQIHNVHVFPGIPRLFEELLDAYLPTLVARMSNTPVRPFMRALVGTQLRESQIAPVLEEMQKKYETMGVKLGSYPNWTPVPTEGAARQPLVVLSAVGSDRGI